MTCIKTGARVRLLDYNCVVAADLYRVGDCTIIRTNEDALKTASFVPEARCTHEAFIPPGGADAYANLQAGFIVVPASCVVEADQ